MYRSRYNAVMSALSGSANQALVRRRGTESGGFFIYSDKLPQAPRPWQDSAMRTSLLIVLLAFGATQSDAAPHPTTNAPSKSLWGKTSDGPVEIYTLTNVH